MPEMARQGDKFNAEVAYTIKKLSNHHDLLFYFNLKDTPPQSESNAARD